MGTRFVGVGVEELNGLSIGSWSRCRDDSAGPCVTWGAAWTTLDGAGGICVEGSGNAKAVTVGATFGVLVGDR